MCVQNQELSRLEEIARNSVLGSTDVDTAYAQIALICRRQKMHHFATCAVCQQSYTIAEDQDSQIWGHFYGEAYT